MSTYGLSVQLMGFPTLIRARNAEQAATYLESCRLRLSNMEAENNPRFEGASSELLAVAQSSSIESFFADVKSNPNI